MIKTFINNLLSKFGYKIQRVNRIESPSPTPIEVSASSNKQKVASHQKVLLNLGSGDWSCDGWINLDYPSDWYKNAQMGHEIVPYDIRKDEIPFLDNSVDAIYCSHVIEHIENVHIERMFRECFRILKKGGVIRIACPDAEFLYQATLANKDYWIWRNGWFNTSTFYTKQFEPRNIDYLVREVATPKLLNYVSSINNIDYIESFQKMGMYDFFEYLTKDLKFRENAIGDHINYWTFEKAKNKLLESGFTTILRSKWAASICKEMQLKSKFDLVHPYMSLYVEAIK